MAKNSSSNGNISHSSRWTISNDAYRSRKNELRTLAELGALNCFAEHRRAAMWRVEETLHDDLVGERGRLARCVRASRDTH